MKEEYIQIPTRKILLWIVILTVSVRICFMLALQSWQFKNNKAIGWEAGEIGSSIASGLGFYWPDNCTRNIGKPPEPTSWEAPVYPFIIGGVFKVFGIYSNVSALVLLVLQTLMSAINCILLFLIGRRVFNTCLGILAAFIFIFYPSNIHFSVMKIGATNLYVTMILLFMLQLFDLSDVPNIKKGILAGFSFGLAILIFPAVISFLPFALAWVLFKGRGERKILIVSVSFVVLAVCVTITPWQIRNYSVFGKFFFIKSNLSRELFMGNYGSHSDLAKERQYIATFDEGQRSELYTKRTLDSILNNPLRLARRSFIRFVRFWTVTPRKGGPRAKISGMKDQVAGITYLIVVVLGIAGLCLTQLKGREVQLLFIAIISLPIPFYLTWFNHFRYRFPIETILIVFASYALYRIYKLLKVKRTETTLN
ncbi:MAG: ArnT family glycosyltransferase [Candidatus Hodarchaeota archaeon]